MPWSETGVGQKKVDAHSQTFRPAQVSPDLFGLKDRFLEGFMEWLDREIDIKSDPRWFVN